MLYPCTVARIGRHFPPKHSSCRGGEIALGLNAHHIHSSVTVEVGRRISGDTSVTDSRRTAGISGANDVLYPCSGSRGFSYQTVTKVLRSVLTTSIAPLPEPISRSAMPRLAFPIFTPSHSVEE